MPRSQVAEDQFNRPDEFPLSDGGKWTGVTLPSTGGPCGLSNNKVNAQAAGGNLKMSSRTSEVFANDQYARIIVAALPVDAGSTGSVGAYVRALGFAPSDHDSYLGHARALTPFTRIMRFDDGLFTTLATTDDADKRFAAADELITEAEDTTIRLFKGSTVVLSAPDATYASGKPGVCAHAPTTTTFGELDSSQLGNIVAAGVGGIGGSLGGGAGYYRLRRGRGRGRGRRR